MDPAPTCWKIVSFCCEYDVSLNICMEYHLSRSMGLLREQAGYAVPLYCTEIQFETGLINI